MFRFLVGLLGRFCRFFLGLPGRREVSLDQVSPVTAANQDQAEGHRGHGPEEGSQTPQPEDVSVRTLLLRSGPPARLPCRIIPQASHLGPNDRDQHSDGWNV